MAIAKRRLTGLVPTQNISNADNTRRKKQHDKRRTFALLERIAILTIVSTFGFLFLLVVPDVPDMMPADTSPISSVQGPSQLRKHSKTLLSLRRAKENNLPSRGLELKNNNAVLETAMGTDKLAKENHDEKFEDSITDANDAPRDNSKAELSKATKEFNKAEQKDLRMQVKRPFMESTSHTFIDSMYDIERRYKPIPECDEWGNTKFIRSLNATAKSLLHDGTSNIISFHNEDTDIYFAENVSVVFTASTNGITPSFHLELDGKFIDDDARLRMKHSRESSLSEMANNAVDQQSLDECSEYIEYPVLLVDSDVDAWNWWFYLKTVFHNYIAVAMVQPMISGNYEQEAMRVLFASPDTTYSRSFLDSFEFMFSDRRGRDSRQIWNVAGIGSGKEEARRLCFRKVLWSPGASTSADKILVNHNHEHSKCFSSIVYSYAAHLKAAMHIPTLPRPEKPRVVFVARDQSDEANQTPWQKGRIFKNQAELIAALKDKCNRIGVELVVADFYGEKKDTPFQEQAVFVSKANIMIGMHGAGLNMFHFMPFNSVVVEIHRGTVAQKNSENFVNHVKEAKYLRVNGKMKNGNIKIEPIWDTLEKAINEWEKLGTYSLL